MPKLWSQTIEDHRHAVQAAILEAAWELVAAHGPMSVTMSQVAERAGIGRATLYKYFPDVEAILFAWHERHIAAHLHELSEIQGDPLGRLEAVLETYALITHRRRDHGADLGAMLHRGEHAARAQQHLTEFVRGLLADAVHSGDVRDDMPVDELANYCLHALSAAATMESAESVRRLVGLVLVGIRAV